MRFALVNNERSEAKPGSQGLCPGCHQPVVAKCGEQRIHHWSHKTKKTCDSWWEPETLWHRSWKNLFPQEWQESIRHDQRSGEKHIADIRTQHGLIIEFQHSSISPEERRSREQFYKNMIWIVDGTRLKRDYLRFIKGMRYRNPTSVKGVFLVPYPEKCFPQSWLQSQVPIFFDFRGCEPIDPPNQTRELLWHLLPERVENNAVVVALIREDFVTEVSNSSNLIEDLSKAHKIAHNSIMRARR